MDRMKMVVGMGSIDDYPELCEAGADEFFCGYVPGEYYKRFSKEQPLNRREVLFYNVQLGSKSEMMILNSMKQKFNADIRITLNALNYSYEQRNYILFFCKDCIKSGYKDFIVAERELAILLGGLEGINLYISGEYGELNIGAVEDLLEQIPAKVFKGLIFPRQTTLSEMKEIIAYVKGIAGYETTAFEAFVLNEKCHFTGAYCNSLHCDELYHMCLEPYKLSENESGTDNADELSDADISSIDSEDTIPGEIFPEEAIACEMLPGETGCAACALWDLREAGITHLKIVGRGNASENIKRDVVFVKHALDILEEAHDREEYICRVKKELFFGNCSGNCYIRYTI